MKSLSAAQTVLSVCVMGLALLQLLGVWPNAIYVYEPLLGALLLVQAAQNWNKSRPVACLSLAVAVLLFATTAYILFR